MKNVIDIAKSNLDLIYKKYKDEGITSIYLWGSITTEDFNPLTSDIDSIAIVNESFDVNLEFQIQSELQAVYDGTNRFGFRVLYVSELKTGLQEKSNLASYISPAFFIFDLPNWMHVAGKKYLQADFTDNIPKISDVIRFRVEEIINRKWQDASEIEVGKEQYYIKCLWRILHLQQLARGESGSFSYTFVAKHANGEEKEIVDILNEIKELQYDREIYLKHVDLLNSFTASIISQ